MNNLWIFDKNKLLILHELYKCHEDKDICGCDLTDMLDIPKNLVSYHIRTLRENGFIHEEKFGQKKKYCLTDKKRDQVVTILKAVELIG